METVLQVSFVDLTTSAGQRQTFLRCDSIRYAGYVLENFTQTNEKQVCVNIPGFSQGHRHVGANIHTAVTANWVLLKVFTHIIGSKDGCICVALSIG